MIVVGVIAVLGIAFEIWSKIAYRRWRKRFDALPPDEQRKEQERMYKVQTRGGWEWGSWEWRSYELRVGELGVESGFVGRPRGRPLSKTPRRFVPSRRFCCLVGATRRMWMVKRPA